MSGAIGFHLLRGLTIASVDGTACNLVTIKTTDGKTFDIETENVWTPAGDIPVLILKEVKEKHA